MFYFNWSIQYTVLQAVPVVSCHPCACMQIICTVTYQMQQPHTVDLNDDTTCSQPYIQPLASYAHRLYVSCSVPWFGRMKATDKERVVSGFSSWPLTSKLLEISFSRVQKYFLCKKHPDNEIQKRLLSQATHFPISQGTTFVEAEGVLPES